MCKYCKTIGPVNNWRECQRCERIAANIRSKVRKGELPPSDKFEVIRSLKKGTECPACNQPINEDHEIYAKHDPERGLPWALHFHNLCAVIWQMETRVAGRTDLSPRDE